MGKFTTRLPLDIKTGDPKNNHIPIYDQTRGVWNTVASSSLIVSSSVSASFATTASYVAGNVLSSSFATTASYVAGTVLSSSYALTSSYAENTKVFPFTGSADISGSLSVRTNNVFISGANEPVLTIRGNYPKINLLGLAGAGNSGSIYMNGSEVRVGGMSANTNLVFMAGGSPTWYIDSTNGDDLIPTLNDFSVYPNIGATTTRVKTIFTTNINSTNPISSSVSASYATTSSFATTASYVAGIVLSASYAATSSIATSASYALTSSFSTTASAATSITFTPPTASYALTSSFATTASYVAGIVLSASYAATSSIATSASYALTASAATSITFTPPTASYAVTSSFATTASYALTSSTATSASYALTSSFATTASYVAGIVLSASYAATSSTATSASYALTASAATSITFTPPTASYALTSSIATSASYALTASAATSITFTPPTASFAITASYVNGTVLSSSYALTSSFSTTASAATSITFTPPTASYALTSSIAASASYALTASAATSITFTPPTASYALTSSIAASASYALTASFSITASTATSITFTPPTASYALTSSIATSASYALTSSYANRATTIFPFSGSAVITGSLTLISGSINVISGSVTASLFGTASVAISSSFTTTASYALSSSFSTTASAATSITFTPPTASYALTSSIATSASYALTASAATSITFTPPTASYAVTSSIATSASYALTSSFATTASTATSITFTPPTASYALTSSIATSASYAITSSHSNRATTIFPFSGSAIITGSLTILSGSINIISGSVTGSLFGTASTAVSSSFATTASYVAATSVVGNVTSASYALTSSFATTASYVAATSVVGNVTSASYALTASFATTASLATSNISTASVSLNTITFTKGDGTQFNIQVSQDGTATSAISASYVEIQASTPGGPFYVPFVDTATGYRKLQSDTDLTYNSSTNILNTTSSYALTASVAISASYALTSSFATTASAATSITFTVNTGSFTGSFIGIHSGSTFGTASVAISSSFATTASYVAAGAVGGTVTSASYALTSSFSVTASAATSITFAVNTGSFTGSFIGTHSGSTFGTASWANNAISSSFATTASAATSITFAVNTGSFTGSFIGTHSGSTFGTSSWAVSASNAITASYVAAGNVGGTVTSASYALTSSYANRATTIFPFSGSAVITGSLTLLSGSINIISGGVTSSVFGTASNAVSSSFSTTASFSTSASYALTSSFTTTASAATSITFTVNTGSFTGSFIGTHSGSTFGTSSWAISSSFATTASYVAAGSVGGTVTSASYAATSSNLIGGATNYIPLWTSATAQSSSNIYQSTGNIGIGITNPAVKLEVGVPGTSDASIIAGIFGKTGGNAYGSTVLRVARYTGTTDLTVATAVEALDLEYNSGGSGPFRYGTFADAVISNEGGATNGPYGAIHFATSGSIRMTVGGGTLAGNVGIGTTSPSYLLDVRANVAAAATPSVTLRLNNQLDGGHRILFSNAAAATLAAIDGDIESSGAGTDDGVLKFWTATNGSMTEKVRIDKSGNVGIGTISPLNGKLHIFGDVAGTFEALNLSNTVSTTAATAIKFGYQVANYGVRIVGYNDAANYYPGELAFERGNGSGYSESMRIDRSGNVGIGTTSPGARLHVQGNVSASSYTSSISNGVGYFGTASYAVTASYVAAGSVGGTVLSASYAATASNLIGGATNYIPLWSTATLQASSVIYQNASNIGIGTTSPTSKLQVAGGISRTNTRVSDSEVYPVGHYTPGETVFEINTTWTDAELRQYFNSANVAWTSSADAPGGYAIYINDVVNVGGEYNSGFPYIPVDQDDVFYMECWIKNVGTSQTHYMGSMEYNHLLSSIGGNPGTYGYWVMSNTNPTTAWTKVSGYIKGFGTSTGQFVVGAKYWTPQALFNYTAGTGTRACVISGWKVIKVNAMGNRFFSGSVGIGTTNPQYKLHVSGGLSLFNSSTAGSDGNSGIRIVSPIATTHYNWMVAAQQNVGAAFEITPSTVVGGATFSTPTAVFTATGRVGIGTVSPTSTLDVNGVSTLRGNLLFGTDNTYDIGGSGVNRPRNIYTSGDAIIAGVRVGRGLGAVVSNTAVGNSALAANTTGFDNVAIGAYALTANVDGSQNTAIGSSALNTTISGVSNTAIGFRALLLNTGGANIAIGNYAGSALTTGDSNTIIGSINGTAGLAGTIILAAGTTERIRVDSSGNMGVGTTAPSAKLHIQGNVSASTYTSSISNGVGYFGTSSYAVTAATVTTVTAANFASQTANTFLAAPNGSAGTPTFRAIVAADVPTLNQNTTGTSTNITAYTINQNVGTSNSPSFVTLTSTQATGTAPFTVASTTLVTNLNADLLDGYNSATAATANTIVLRDGSGNGQFNRVGIGISPTYDLHIAKTTSPSIYLESGNDDSKIYLTDTTKYIAGLAASAIGIYTDSGIRSRYDIYGTRVYGSLGVGVQPDVGWSAGEIRATSMTLTGTATVQTLVETSTQELKKNITPIESTITTLSKLEPSRFDWISSNEPDIGLIAEQVEQIFPELVTHDTNGKLMGVKYSKLTVLLLKAVQEMSQKIERLEQQSIYKSTH